MLTLAFSSKVPMHTSRASQGLQHDRRLSVSLIYLHVVSNTSDTEYLILSPLMHFGITQSAQTWPNLSDPAPGQKTKSVSHSDCEPVSRPVCIWPYPVSSHWHVPVLPRQCRDPDGMRRQWPGRRPVCLPDWQQLCARGSLSSSSHDNNTQLTTRKTKREPDCNHSMPSISGQKSPCLMFAAVRDGTEKNKKNPLAHEHELRGYFFYFF